jgi:hypothetical protein
MSSKGLPGFLRRSLRRDFDEEDEADRQSASNNFNSSLGNIKLSNVVVVPDPGSNNKTSHDGNGNNNGSGPLNNDNADYPSNGGDAAQEDDDLNHNEDYDHKISPPVRLDSGLSSLESSPDNNTNDIDNDISRLTTLSSSSSSIVRQFTYRETQFEKTISADVVKMVELRNLGWNGIPVRTFCNNESILYRRVCRHWSNAPSSFWMRYLD